MERVFRGLRPKEIEQPQEHTIRAHHLPWYIGLVEAQRLYPDTPASELIAMLVNTMIEADLTDTPEKQTDFFGENLSGIETVRVNWIRTFTEFLQLRPEDTVIVTDAPGEICKGCIIGEHCKIQGTPTQPLFDSMMVYRIVGAYNTYFKDVEPKRFEQAVNGDYTVAFSAQSFPSLLRTWYHDENRQYGMPVSTGLIVDTYMQALQNLNE